MADEYLIRVLAWVESWGVWLSWVAWLTVSLGSVAMAHVLRRQARPVAWRPALVVGGLALAAHMADYFITLERSPDLALELNPLWRNVLNAAGLTVAKWYGLTGKIFLSILAAQMTAFYLADRERLYPESARDFTGFVRALGERSRSWRDRAAALFTVFAFFFAGLSFFYFYIAWQNSLTDPEVVERLWSTPAALGVYVLAMVPVFAAVTYRGYRRSRLAGALAAAAAAAEAAGEGK